MIRLDNCAAIMVAAGLSSRFGPEDKLMAEINGRPLLYWSLQPVMSAGLSQVILVTGANNKAARSLCAGAPVTIVENPDPAAGLGRSIALGAAAVDKDASGVFVCLGDMPLIADCVFERLADALAEDELADAAAPVYEGQRGHPVLFHNRHIGALKKLECEDGAKSVLTASEFNLRSIEVHDEGVVVDVDTRDDFIRIERIMNAHSAS